MIKSFPSCCTFHIRLWVGFFAVVVIPLDLLKYTSRIMMIKVGPQQCSLKYTSPHNERQRSFICASHFSFVCDRSHWIADKDDPERHTVSKGSATCRYGIVKLANAVNWERNCFRCSPSGRNTNLLGMLRRTTENLTLFVRNIETSCQMLSFEQL